MMKDELTVETSSGYKRQVPRSMQTSWISCEYYRNKNDNLRMECDFHGRETKHVGEIVNILPGKTLKYKDKHDHDLGFSLTFKNDVTCMLKPASIIDGLAKQITIKCSFTKQLKKIQHLALQEDA